MRILLFIFALAAFFAGAVILFREHDAIHEIEGLLVCLIGAVFLCGAAITEAINFASRSDGITQYRKD